jgi:hypothetical protein
MMRKGDIDIAIAFDAALHTLPYLELLDMLNASFWPVRLVSSRYGTWLQWR